MMHQQNFLIMLAGLPASGKSTLALELKIELERAYPNRRVEIVDIDEIRAYLTGDLFDPEKENEVRLKSLEKIFTLLKNGNIVISDDLNYYASMRHDLKEIADELNIPFFTIHITTPLETCLLWNKKRKAKIPSDLISTIHEKFDSFDKYAWDYPFATLDLSKMKNVIPWIRDLIMLINSSLTKFQEKNNLNALKQDTSNQKKEAIDRITRRIVGEELKTPDKFSCKAQILKLRKKFLMTNLNENFTIEEIESKFKDFLKDNLDGENLKEKSA